MHFNEAVIKYLSKVQAEVQFLLKAIKTSLSFHEPYKTVKLVNFLSNSLKKLDYFMSNLKVFLLKSVLQNGTLEATASISGEPDKLVELKEKSAKLENFDFDLTNSLADLIIQLKQYLADYGKSDYFVKEELKCVSSTLIESVSFIVSCLDIFEMKSASALLNYGSDAMQDVASSIKLGINLDDAKPNTQLDCTKSDAFKYNPKSFFTLLLSCIKRKEAVKIIALLNCDLAVIESDLLFAKGKRKVLKKFMKLISETSDLWDELESECGYYLSLVELSTFEKKDDGLCGLRRASLPIDLSKLSSASAGKGGFNEREFEDWSGISSALKTSDPMGNDAKEKEVKKGDVRAANMANILPSHSLRQSKSFLDAKSDSIAATQDLILSLCTSLQTLLSSYSNNACLEVIMNATVLESTFNQPRYAAGYSASSLPFSSSSLPTVSSSKSLMHMWNSFKPIIQECKEMFNNAYKSVLNNPDCCNRQVLNRISIDFLDSVLNLYHLSQHLDEGKDESKSSNSSRHNRKTIIEESVDEDLKDSSVRLEMASSSSSSIDNFPTEEIKARKGKGHRYAHSTSNPPYTKMSSVKKIFFDTAKSMSSHSFFKRSLAANNNIKPIQRRLSIHNCIQDLVKNIENDTSKTLLYEDNYKAKNVVVLEDWNYLHTANSEVLVTSKVLKGGSLDKLIDKLIWFQPISTELNFTTDFILCFHLFCKPKYLLSRLEKRYSDWDFSKNGGKMDYSDKIHTDKPPIGDSRKIAESSDWNLPKMDDMQQRYFNDQVVCRVHNKILQVLKLWIEIHAYDFVTVGGLAVEAKQFISKYMDLQMKEAFLRLFPESESFRKYIEDSQDLLFPPSILPKSVDFINLFIINPLELARQLTLIDYSLLVKIPLQEFTSKDNLNISVMIQRFNFITQWVITEILYCKNIKERSKAIQLFIKIGQKCFELNNFNSLNAILAGLQSASVHRLKKTWQLISKKRMMQYEELSKLMTSENNYQILRETLEHAKLPCIPWIGLYLRDITFLMDAHPTYLKEYPNFINYGKVRLLAPILKQIVEFQRESYKFHVVECLQKYLQSDKGLLKTENDQFKVSLMLEPKE